MYSCAECPDVFNRIGKDYWTIKKKKISSHTSLQCPTCTNTFICLTWWTSMKHNPTVHVGQQAYLIRLNAIFRKAPSLLANVLSCKVLNILWQLQYSVEFYNSVVSGRFYTALAGVYIITCMGRATWRDGAFGHPSWRAERCVNSRDAIVTDS